MSALEPNTPEWEAMRKTKIGASDAPVILGSSPYKTAYQLWEEKLGLSPPSPQNFAMQRGHDLEPMARRRLEEMTGILFRPVVKFHSSIEWMMCSADALSLDETVLAEIKCGGKEDHDTALGGKVPEKYVPQLQHQMEVCEVDSALYFSFDGTAGVVVKIFRDDHFIKQMLKKEEEFYECLHTITPPEMTEKDYRVVENPEWLHFACQWKETHAQLKELERKEKQLRESLISLSQNQSSCGAGIKLRKIVEKGRVNYKAIPELKEVNLEDYRGMPVEKWRLLFK